MKVGCLWVANEEMSEIGKRGIESGQSPVARSTQLQKVQEPANGGT